MTMTVRERIQMAVVTRSADNTGTVFTLDDGQAFTVTDGDSVQVAPVFWSGWPLYAVQIGPLTP